MRIITYIMFLYFVISCQPISEKKIYGKYTPVLYKNTYDTLVIERNSFYNRVVYDKNRKMLLNYKAKYKLIGNSIKFDDFYFNLDKDLTVFPEDVKDIDMTFTTNIENIDGNIGFCFGYHDGENCYKKISK